MIRCKDKDIGSDMEALMLLMEAANTQDDLMYFRIGLMIVGHLHAEVSLLGVDDFNVIHDNGTFHLCDADTLVHKNVTVNKAIDWLFFGTENETQRAESVAFKSPVHAATAKRLRDKETSEAIAMYTNSVDGNRTVMH